MKFDKKRIFDFAIGKGYSMNKGGEMLNPNGNSIGSISNQGYPRTSIMVDAKKETIQGHQFQAYLKFGDRVFREGVVVRHLNGDRSDNSFGNIDIGTHSDNMQDKPAAQRIRDAMTYKRFSEYQISEILRMRDRGATYKEIGTRFRVSKSTLSYLFNKAYYTGARSLPQD